jgi:hypothetical protein
MLSPDIGVAHVARMQEAHGILPKLPSGLSRKAL